MKRLILILLVFYGLVNQVSARLIPASVYENSYRHSLIEADNQRNFIRQLLTLTHVKESHDMEVVENIETFTDKNHAEYSFFEKITTMEFFKAEHGVLTSIRDKTFFHSRFIRLLLFPFHNFI